MSKSAIDFMDKLGISIDKLNDFGAVLNKLGLETAEASARISELFENIESGASVASSIKTIFSDVLSAYAPGSAEYKAVYNQLLKAYQNAAGTGLTNMGQNLKALQSQINAFYEKAAK